MGNPRGGRGLISGSLWGSGVGLKSPWGSRVPKKIQRTCLIVISYHLRLRKVDFVLAVGIWVGLGPELGSKKQSGNKQKVCFYNASYKPNLTISNRDMSMYYS